MTPNDIDILIHYHCSSSRHDRFDAPTVQESLIWMVEDDLLEFCSPDSYRTTEKGKAHVRQLCNLPLPKSVFIDGHGDIIQLDVY